MTRTAPANAQSLQRRPLVAGAKLGAVAADRRDENQQMLLDVVKVRSEVLARNSSTARGVNGVIKVASSFQNASEDDKFYAASSAIGAMEKLTPVLAGSAVGAGTSAVVLALGDDELKKQHQAFSESLTQAFDAKQSKDQRSKAAVDAALGASNVATVGRAIGKAAGNVGKFGLKVVGQVEAFAPAIGKTEVLLAKTAATPVGRSVAFLNKWIPLLNVTWVGLSVKTAIDVHRDPQASGATKALSIASVGTSTAVFGAGLALSGWAFAGVTAGSVLVDLALAYSRKKDHAA